MWKEWSMRLDFNVLWVEDQPDTVVSYQVAIRRAFSEEGFDLQVFPHQTLETVRDSIRETVFSDQIDLVLVDWDLGANLKGERVIQAIREQIRYRDVVFYSAETDIGKLQECAKGIEGVYWTTRNDLVQLVKELFENLVRKVLDIDHMRGIVMGATSDIDELIRECLRAFDKDGNGKSHGILIGEALVLAQKALDRFAKKHEGLKNDCTLEGLFREHDLLTSATRIDLLLLAMKKSLGRVNTI
jgi:hypothetical protein